MATKTSYAPGTFSWVDLMAHDIAGAKSFYGDLFGWTARDMDTQGGPPYVQFELGGDGVAGMGQMQDEMKSQGMPPVWNNYVTVENVEDTAKQAAELGGTVVMPAMDVVGAGWMAIIQDPTGAHLSLWQPNAHFGAQRVNEPGTFCWNEMATRDIEKAREFFGALLGWEFADNPGSPSKYYIIKNQGQDNGGLMQMTSEWEGIPPHWAVYFAVEDTDASAKRVEELGGKVTVQPFDIPVGRMAVVADAQGAMFSLIKITVDGT